MQEKVLRNEHKVESTPGLLRHFSGARQARRRRES